MSSRPKAVILFLKYPEPGKVKTRLAATIGKREAAHLYRTLVEDLLYRLRGEDQTIFLFYTPDSSVPQLQNWLGRQDKYCAQKGKNLGERMEYAFAHVFSLGYKEVILIGTDIPGINQDIIDTAFQSLQTHEIVLGPSRDGGYYLVGLATARLAGVTFEHIPWSTDQVWTQTVHLLERLALRYFTLRELVDLDEWTDIEDILKSCDPAVLPRSYPLLQSYVKKDR